MRALSALLFAGGGSTFLGPVDALINIPKTGFLIFANLIGSNNLLLTKFLMVFIALTAVLIIRNRRKETFFDKAITILLVWLVIGIIGVAFFNHEIYSHYFGFLFPAPFILFAGLSKYVIDGLKTAGKILIGIIVAAILVVSFTNSPLRAEPGYQMERAIRVAQKIKEEARGKRFNMAVIADSNYEDGYKYFLEAWGEKVVFLDPERYKESVTSQLFVVCEKQEEKCDPTHSPKAEVANFGWSRVSGEWKVNGVVLYRLIHSK